MAMRLPGGISSGEEFWDLLVNKRDGCARIPASRYATHGPQGNLNTASPSSPATGGKQADDDSAPDKPHWRTHGYMLNHVDLAAFDASLFSMTRAELGVVDPQQRLLLELTRECFENAGETDWRGKDIGVYIGIFGEDWNDIQHHDRQDMYLYKLVGMSDFVAANRISYEYDLKGPSMVLRTGCSASLYGLHTACQSLQSGEISSALIGGCNLIMNSAKVETIFHAGVLSTDVSSKSFDAAADGYARGEAVNMIYIKRLDDALRDGNPIRAVIRGTSTNCDGKTMGLTKPGSDAHEALIRATYAAAGLENEMGRTGFFECHATGTSSGDPEEARAVARVFGDKGGMYIGSVKPNMGHSEGGSGLTSLLKCVLALENRVIPPNIKFHRPNPNIPFEQGGLRVPTEPIPWPQDRLERTSINSFGVGGANAHVIIDSADEFGVRLLGNYPLPTCSTTTSSNAHRLLVFTANDADSARRGAMACSQHLATASHEDMKYNTVLTDAAFTLGMRRQYLAYRSFAIGEVKNQTSGGDGGGHVEFSAPVKAAAVAPSVAFVFTGQGAQWPEMGATLLQEYPSALQQIQLMEMSLSSLGPDLAPDWTLSEELMRPKESTKVYKAEFSQPLCTAVQILVVNLLRDWGIVPAAVIGHSSGEIAAAYASGALTMEGAIVCAYLRGKVVATAAKRRTIAIPGAMAAVGLGATDVRHYLVDGVVVACENSPSSTTLSGDKDKIVQVMREMEQDRPGVFTRRLQVDMAYHSHHMRELGGEYERLLGPRISAKAPLVPFFSTVSNNILCKDGELGAAYWRSNLESPVLFHTGVENLLVEQTRIGKTTVLVEVGPHNALAGPLRQILKHLSAEQQASYLPTLVRNENESWALLASAGQLFCKGLPTIRFEAVNPPGHVLTNMPSYPWNHGTKYWYESRISNEFRTRKYAHHEILGSRVLEGSQTEPSWRNMMRLDKIPWCNHHKVGDDIVFPGTGFLAMAGEAMRQLTSGARHVAFRQVTIASALILSSSASSEVVLSMRPHRLTDSLDSNWHEFTVSSYNETSDSWIKHCFGQVREASDQDTWSRLRPKDISHLPRHVGTDNWYKALRGAGLNYGPAFQGLGQISADPLHNIAVADVDLEPAAAAISESESQDPDSATYHVHPATADACMQLFTAAVARGQARLLPGRTIPTYIEEAYFSAAALSGSTRSLAAEATCELQSNGGLLGRCIAVDPSSNAVVLTLHNVKLSPLGDNDSGERTANNLNINFANDPHAGARLHWKPDLDLIQDLGGLLHSRRQDRETYYRLQKLVLLCCIVAQERCGKIDTQIDHLVKFQTWIRRQVEQAEREPACYPLLSLGEVVELLQLPKVSPAVDQTNRIAEYLDDVLKTGYASIGKVVHRVFASLESILLGEVDGLEIVRGGQDDGALADIYSLGNRNWDYGPFLNLLGHRTPHLRVLEIGAGTGGTTDLVLKSLGDTNLYAYTFTDISAAFFPAARDRFSRRFSRMRFQTLDITRDPIEQRFAPASFDLVVAANVLHATPVLATTLINVRKLLRPGGKLLLQEMQMDVKWLNFAMGPLPGWWSSEDGRSEEPYVSPEKWAEELVAAGFSPPEASVYDDEAPYQANVTIIASPAVERDLHVTPDEAYVEEMVISLLTRDPEKGNVVATSLSAALQRRLGSNTRIEVVTVADLVSQGPKTRRTRSVIISILDLDGPDPYLASGAMTGDEFAQIQAFLGSGVTTDGILWLTRPIQISCRDPRYAGILGLLRTVRSELGAPVFTLELEDKQLDLDKMGGSIDADDWTVVLDVYQKAMSTMMMRAAGKEERDREQDLLATDPDYEYAVSGGRVYIPRFHWISVDAELNETLPTAKGKKQEHYTRLELGKRGSLQSMKWVQRPIVDDLKGDEIYVDIKAVGMNFKDTLIAMGIIDGPGEAGDGFGVEFAGVIRAVGPSVDSSRLSAGDRVMGITSDAYATMTRTAASRVFRIPDEDLTFEDAATMPCVYPTVIHGLINLARLESGQSVLIHSACGGVGLAALHICQMLGVSEVYATVGGSTSEEKKRYLMDTFGIPRSRIFSSRDASFLSAVMLQTDGRGVDVVLNSLSGQLLHASWNCVAEFGSMVEIGKRDFLGHGRLEMEPFADNRSFFGVEMWPIIVKQPARIQKLIDQFMCYYRTGMLKPIRPVRVFDAVEVEAAIRTMQKGQHIGKFVVRIPDDTSVIKSSLPTRRSRPPFILRADASYLVVGGLGGLGRSIATWMAEHGARHFVFLSRSAHNKNPHAETLTRDLKGSGCTVDMVAGSVTKMSDVMQAVNLAARTRPIAGVVQLSMVLRDRLFSDMAFSDWEAVTAPKMQGTENLHAALLSVIDPKEKQQDNLDFFVLFSSIAGLVGQRGQANYAAANTFLDAFIQYRHSLGLTGSVLDVGAVGDVGFVAERSDLVNFFKSTSNYLLHEQDVLDAFELAIRKSAASPDQQTIYDSFVSESQVTLGVRSTMPLASPQNRLVWKRDPRLGGYHNLEAVDQSTTPSPNGKPNGKPNVNGSNITTSGHQDAAIRTLLAQVEQDPSLLDQDAVMKQFATLIGIAFFGFMMKPVEELDITARLPTLGIDSLVAIEVRNWLRQRFAVDMTVLEILRAESIMGIAKAWAKKFLAKMNM
ncbi:hypothetical protein V8F06_009003 [Rhypophila decipiens]